MKLSDYTLAQQDAITKDGQNIIVSAGAGSGKTQVLTERVVHFVKNKNYKLNEFLILTFTNLAAGEMRNRIRKELKAQKLAEGDKVDFADICTFDSYALSLVKKYHFMLNVSPDISIIDSNIIDVRKRRIIEQLFEEQYAKQDPNFMAMVKRFCFKDDDDLRSLVLKFYNKSLLEIDKDSYIDNFVNKFYSDEMIETYKNELIESFKNEKEEIFKLAYQLPDEALLNGEERSILKVYLDFLAPLKNATSYKEFITSLDGKATSHSLQSHHDSVKNIKDALSKKITALQKEFEKLPQDDEEFKNYFASTIPFASLFVDIIKKIDKEINSFKEKYQSYEFLDIAKMALKLVKENKDIRTSLMNNYKMIMIDEYQDTSDIQEEFINQIQNNNVYMVGDIKQSIYRFRNARCDIFVDKYRKYKSGVGGVAIDLNTNFRSRKEVLDDINYIFKQLMTPKYGGADYAKEHVIEYGNKQYLYAGDSKHSNHLDVLMYKCEKEKSPKYEATLIAKDIIDKINSKYLVMDFKDNKSYLRPCKFSDFCILMDRGVQFETYAEVFNEFKLPLHVENDEDISNNDIVIVLTNILRLVKAIKVNDYTSDDFRNAFLSVARSFLLEYSDSDLLNVFQCDSFYDEPFIVRLRETIYDCNYLSISKLFEKIIFEFDFYHKCILIGNVAKAEKYLNTFLELFKNMSSLDYTIDDFILFMESIDDYDLKITLSSSGSSIDSVQIMNVHKSKGLEFKIVYYSGLYKQFYVGDLNNDFGISSKYGLFFAPENPNNINILKRLNKKYEDEQNISEKIRLFYVALTRAKEKIICLHNCDEADNLLLEHSKRKVVEYKATHNYDSLSKDEALEIVYNDFINKNINEIMLNILLEEKDVAIPFQFTNLDNDKKINVSLSQFKKFIEEEYEYRKSVEKYASRLKSDNACLEDCVMSAFSDYKNGGINFKFFINVAKILNVGFSEEFEDKFLCDECGDYDVDKNTIELNKDDIICLDNYENGLYYNPCKYLDCLLNILHDVIDLKIGSAEFKMFAEDLHLDINPNALTLIEQLNAKNATQFPKSFFSSSLIINPDFNYNKEDVDIEFIGILKSLLTNEERRKDVLKLFNYYFEYIPLYSELCMSIKKLADKEITFDEFSKYVTLSNYKILFKEDEVSGMCDVLNNGKLSVDDFIRYFEPTSKLLDEQLLIGDYPFINLSKSLFEDYKAGKISLDDFNRNLDCFNLELTKSFAILSETEQKQYKSDDIDEIVVEKGEIRADFNKANSFKAFIEPYFDYRKFNHYTIDMFINASLINNASETIDYDITIDEIQTNIKVIEPFRPSKQINLDTNTTSLDYGNKLHLAMEVTNLANPNYSHIDPSLVKYVERFIKSDLCKNVAQGVAYKEYEFIDEVNNVQGIIDLFIVYDDHIDIIDYKTKNIDDESYDKQLSIYKKYIERKFGKTVRTYLYSLLDGVYKETTF